MKPNSKTNKKRSKQPISLITGAAGFLGSHLTDLLLQRGHKVIGIDNLVTGSVDNIAHLAGNRSFRFIEQDVTEFLFIDSQVDYVWHFASPASPIDYLELPIQTLKVGSLGTHKALGLAKSKGARFLLASTSEVYGDPLVHPQPEEYWGNVNIVGPRGCYDEAKRRPTWVPTEGLSPGDLPVSRDATGPVIARDQLGRALGQLSMEHRAVLVLRYLMDLSPREVGETLGIPRRTVYSRLQRALDSVRGVLEAENRPIDQPTVSQEAGR